MRRGTQCGRGPRLAADGATWQWAIPGAAAGALVGAAAALRYRRRTTARGEPPRQQLLDA
ncbi:hypothetical protein RB200_30435 [Streptomyces sp. PmtG]